MHGRAESQNVRLMCGPLKPSNQPSPNRARFRRNGWVLGAKFVRHKTSSRKYLGRFWRAQKGDLMTCLKRDELLGLLRHIRGWKRQVEL
jgi:hypothetical protein